MERKLDEAETVASPLAALLFGMLDDRYDGVKRALPARIGEQAATDRVAVWSAVGMMVSTADLSDAEALAGLRAFARGNDLSLDAATARLVDRRLRLQAVLGWWLRRPIGS